VNEQVLDSLLEWWQTSNTKPCPLSFSVGFEFNSGIEKQNADEWVAFCSYGAGWTGFCELARIVAPSRSAVVFEVTEEVSALRYRMSWLVDFQADKLHRVLETRSKIP
jgi:hypothetical protein